MTKSVTLQTFQSDFNEPLSREKPQENQSGLGLSERDASGHKVPIKTQQKFHNRVFVIWYKNAPTHWFDYCVITKTATIKRTHSPQITLNSEVELIELFSNFFN